MVKPKSKAYKDANGESCLPVKVTDGGKYLYEISIRVINEEGNGFQKLPNGTWKMKKIRGVTTKDPPQKHREW